MPNIKEYTSPIDKLTPDERGFTAWETAGRRIGPLYNQAASDVERGGKLDEQALAQADKLNTHELDYLGLLGKQQQQQHFAHGGGGGVGGGGGGGGGRQQQDPPLRTYNPGPSIANAAANLTGAAAALTGHQEGRGIYGPGRDDMTTRTDSGGYNQQNPGGLSDTLTPQQVKQGLAQGDALYQRRLAGEQESYANTSGYKTQMGAGMGEGMVGPYAIEGYNPATDDGLFNKVSNTLRSLAYGGTDAAPIAEASQAAQDAAVPDVPGF